MCLSESESDSDLEGLETIDDMDGFGTDDVTVQSDIRTRTCGYKVALLEKNPESVLNTRPIARGCLNENDQFSTIQLMRHIEIQRKALKEELEMHVKISDQYSLAIDFNITASKVDKKWRDASVSMKAGRISFPPI